MEKKQDLSGNVKYKWDLNCEMWENRIRFQEGKEKIVHSVKG